MIQDLRFIKTEENLRQAILELLKEKNYNKITVTDICKKAKCSRNAFYLHYESKENLYDAIIMDIIIDIEDSCRPVVEKLSDIGATESKEYLSNILNAVEKHRPVLSQLLENEQVNFSKNLKNIMIESISTNAKKFNQETDLDYIHYFASGIAGYIEFWIMQTDYSLDVAKEKLFAITVQQPYTNKNT